MVYGKGQWYKTAHWVYTAVFSGCISWKWCVSVYPRSICNYGSAGKWKRLNRWRSYSIANRPYGTNILEFCIVKSQDGPGTRFLFEEVQVGSVLKFKGPDGGFVIPANLDVEIIMLCTGTGVAPFRSMIHHLVENKIPFRSIHLIFGTRTENSILYRDEFEKFRKTILVSNIQ